MRADANNGYVSAFELYTGKNGNTSEKCLSAAKVVKGLTELLHGTYCQCFVATSFLMWILHWIYLELGCTAMESSEATARVSPPY